MSLHQGAWSNSTYIAKHLAERGAEIEARDKKKYNASSLRHTKKQERTTKLLMERGTEIEERNVNNTTPLHEAAWNNSTEIAKPLLKHGAEIEARDKKER